MKIPKVLVVYLIIVCPIILGVVFTTVSGIVNIKYQGFAVDEYENIYLGKKSTITVLDKNGKLLREINSMTSRGYNFTILNGDCIVINTDDVYYKMDLYGNVVERIVIDENNSENIPKITANNYVNTKGIKYIMKNNFLRTYIYRIEGNERTQIYKMPILDYVIKILFFICVGSAFVVIPICIWKWRKRQSETQGEETQGDGSIVLRL